jgi:hypothetical protein
LNQSQAGWLSLGIALGYDEIGQPYQTEGKELTG